jgi:hypothetical protein
MSFYEVWDARSGNLLGSYGTEAEALALVRDLSAQADAEVLPHLGLVWADDEDEEQGGPVAEGAALVEHARAVNPRRSPLSA